MGYYVNIVNSTCTLSKKKADKAYKILCELNNRNDLKNGGSSPRTKEDEAEIKAGKPNKTIWFSWMPWNYPETCKTVQEIFEKLGFTISEDDGFIYINGYDSKTGNEDAFLEAIGKLLRGEIEWSGEDDNKWKNVFGPKGMKTYQGRTVYEEI